MSSIFNNGDRRFLELSQNVASLDMVMRVNRIPCPYVEIVGDEVKELASWLLIRHDLQKVIGFLDLFLRLEQRNGGKILVSEGSDTRSITRESLFISAIVTYGKCFNEARGRMKRLTPDSILGPKNSEKLRIHREMIGIRNKFVAHGDTSIHEEVTVRVALNPDLQNKQIITTYYQTRSTSGLNPDQVKGFLGVIEIFLVCAQ